MTNKDAVAHSLLQQEALFKISLLLDQLRDGLKKVGILSLIVAFPQLFHDLFTFAGEVDSEEVIRALYVDHDEISDPVGMAFLHRYLKNLTNKGILMYSYGN